MLVLAQNLVLAEADTIPDGTPYIGIHSLVTISNITADLEDDDYPVTNLANPLTTNGWRSTTQDAQEITAVVNATDDIDYAGIAGHNFGTAGIAVSIYYDNGGGPVLLAGPQIPADDQPLLFVWTPAQYATIIVSLAASSVEEPRADVLKIGKLLVCERGYPVDGKLKIPPFGRKTQIVNGRSESGNFTGRIVTGQSRKFEIPFTNFTADWYREFFDPFLEQAQGNDAFFYAWKPTDYAYEVAYAWLEGEDPEPLVDPVTDRVDVTLVCGGIHE